MKLLVFNLKTYAGIKESASLTSIINSIRTNHRLIVAPPLLALDFISKKPMRKNVFLCAQDFDYAKGHGAHTGDILIDDLKELGCRYALIGHSELRRRESPRIGDSEELISKKIRVCIDQGISPIFCFGESKKEGAVIVQKEIARQLRLAVPELQKAKTRQIVIVYEPQWTISATKGARRSGMGEVATIRRIVERIIGKKFRYLFLYGGSVNGENIDEYLSSKVVDGVLIGRAATRRDSLRKIAAAL